MKLQCQVEVINRLHNLKLNKKCLKSTLALCKDPKNGTEYYLLHFSSANKTGAKYLIKSIKQVFVKCINEGKATLRLEDPPYDILIKSEPIQLKSFLKLIKLCITGNTKDIKISEVSSISVTPKDNAPTKLVIKDRSDFPIKGFPRTLEYLCMKGLRVCNFRRGILLLKHLTILDMSDNEIERLPPELGTLPNLSELHLNNNHLGVNGEVDWRWLLGPQITKVLKLLDISGNQIRILPKAIWKLQKLVTLKLSNNSLESLPPTIGRINTLRYLAISQNSLETLPRSLLRCRLTYIDLSSNKFHTRIDATPKNSVALRKYNDWNLIELASKAVLRHKLFYAPNIIPWTLVEFLDNANVCNCGSPVVNDNLRSVKEYELKDYFSTVVCDNNSITKVGFECHCCSIKCYMKNQLSMFAFV